MKKLREDIRNYIEERGWDILKHPGSIAKSISIESSELLEIFQWEEFSTKKIQGDEKLLTAVKGKDSEYMKIKLQHRAGR